MTDGKELDEFHIDQPRPGPQRQSICITTHIHRGAVSPVETRQAACRQNNRLGVDPHSFTGFQVESYGPSNLPLFDHDTGNRKFSRPAQMVSAPDLRAQGLGDGRAGIEKIDIDAAFDIMARRHDLLDANSLARPTDLPVFQLPDTGRCVLTKS